jgi:cysteine desulfurase
MHKKMKTKRIYLDYAATAPVSDGVFRAMKPYFSEVFGNTESIHSFGQEAMQALDDARETIAKALQVNFREIVFTSGATEANNLALFGTLANVTDLPKSFIPNIVVSSIEHASVFSACEALRRKGVEIRFAAPDANGIVSPESIKELLDERTIFVSVMYGNNEVGTIQPIPAIGKIIRDFRGDKKFPLFHTDAVQVFQFLSLHPYELNADLVTLSSHKLYGPKGAGMLFVRGGVAISPISFGGNQEFGFRPGTINVPSIVGFAKAIEEAEKNRETRGKNIFALKKYFLSAIKKLGKLAVINGVAESGKTFRKSLPNIVSVYFPKNTAESVVVALDLADIAVSAGSACNARGTTSSRVIREITNNEERARKSVRFSFGEKTTKAELQKVIKELQKILG